MDGNLDKVREALDRLKGFTHHAADNQDAEDIKTVCSALSAIDSEAIRRESKAELIKKLTPIIEDMDCTCGGESDDSDHSYEVCGCWKHELQAIISAKPAQNDRKPEANDNEQLDLVLKIRNDCTLDEALIAMQAFILYHDAEVKRRIEEAKE